MAAAVKQVDLLTLMTEMAVKSGETKYDDKEQAMYFLIAKLILAIEGVGGKVKEMAEESSAFSDMQSITQKVDRDLTHIKQWLADPKNKGKDIYDAQNDPEFKKCVAEFKEHLKEMRHLAQQYNMVDKYKKDGMDESMQSNNMIWNDKINWRPDGTQSESIGDLINGNKDDALAAALFSGAKEAATKSDAGTFYKWTESGAAGSPSLKAVETDYQSFISAKNQETQVQTTALQNDFQMGQNFNKSLESLLNTIIQHLSEHA